MWITDWLGELSRAAVSPATHTPFLMNLITLAACSGRGSCMWLAQRLSSRPHILFLLVMIWDGMASGFMAMKSTHPVN